MAFRFSLESVLRLRRSEQRHHELLLQKANEQVNGFAREVEAIESEGREIASRSTVVPFTGADLHFDQTRCQVLVVRRVQAEQRLQAAREQQALAAEEFQRAWQRREALDTLRERERQFYMLAESRIEQRRQDDRFLQSNRRG